MYVKNYIVIAGLIGAGKSSLAKRLGEALGWEVAYEAVAGNPYLADFYKDMKKYGTIMQLWLLNHRFRQHKELITKISNGTIAGAVGDRSVVEDTIFARMLHESGNITDRDLNTYLDIFDALALRDLAYPEIMIYLDCSAETALKRIQSRGREAEKNIPLAYLQDLRAHYLDFLSEYKKTGVNILSIPYETFPSVEYIVDLIKRNQINECKYTKWIRPPRVSETKKEVKETK